MRVLPFFFSPLAMVGVAIALGGCQGNLGSGSGLSIPAAAPYNQPGGPGNAAPQSRQRTLDGGVFLTEDMATLPLPDLDGFGVTLQLGTPPPTPSPTPSGTTPAPSAGPASATTKRRTKLRAATALAAVPPTPALSANSASPSAAPSPGPSPSGASLGSPAPTGSPLAANASPLAANGSPLATKASPLATKAPAKTVTKLVVYPDDAPAAPTPQPSGNIQSYPVRKALVRGYLKPVADLPLYGLGAIKFTIPTAEDTDGRGYTVALFASGKHHRDTLVASDPKATSAAHIVASEALDGLVLKKNIGYLVVLYADELAATPAPVPSGYPQPGNNPFYTPGPSTSPPGSNLPGAGQTYPYPSPTPTYPH